MEYVPCAATPLDHCGSAVAEHAEDTEFKNQTPRELSPVRAAVLREDVAVWFEIDVDSTYAALVATVKASRQRTMTPAESRLFGIDKLNV